MWIMPLESQRHCPLHLDLALAAARLISFYWFCINQPYSQQNKART